MNEYLIKQPLRQWWLTALLIAVNIGVFIAQVFQGVSFTEPSIVDLINWGADFAPLTLTTENWRLLSSMFLHIGIVHLLVNMWALYLFGTYAEFYYSRLWYVLIYVLGGIGGNLASNFVSVQDAAKFLQSPTAEALQRYVPSVGAGASGAIMALGGALLIAALWPKADLEPKYRLNKNALVMLVLLNLGFGLFVEGINNAAHLGGFIVGVVLAVGYRISLTLPLSAKYAVQLLMAVAAIYVSYAINEWLMIQAQHMLPFWSKYLIIR